LTGCPEKMQVVELRAMNAVPLKSSINAKKKKKRSTSRTKKGLLVSDN